MTTIQIKKTHEEPGETSLAVTVPPENVRQAEERATRDWQSRARLPGFRKGKAPTAVVRKRFADDIRQQVLQELLQESWKAVLAQEQLKPIADPHIHNLKWEEGAPVTFEFHVEVKPDLKLERLGGFRLKRTVPPVTAEQVEAQLQELREKRAPWTPVSAEKPRAKDLVHVTIAQRQGSEVKDHQPYQFVLGEGRAIPEVEERIMSLLPGETVDAMVRFPEDFPEEAKRGQIREIRPVAEAQVRRDLVLDAVVEQQKLYATEAELDERVQQLAARRQVPAGQLYASLEKAKRLRDVERSITEEKVFAYLLSQSTVELS